MFRFRLQRVLELREKKEQAQAIELARAEETATAARTQHDELKALHQASRAQISNTQGATHTVGHLHHLGFVLSALDHRLGHAAQVVTRAEGAVSEARVSLEAAARDRRVLDRLKDRHSDAHRADEAHRDRVTMDEVALALFTRQRQATQREATQREATQREATQREATQREATQRDASDAATSDAERELNQQKSQLPDGAPEA